MKTIKFAMLVFLLLMFNACSKEKEPLLPDGKVYEVTFSPMLYGNPVPWLAKEGATPKSFGTFVHKWLNHVIRIRTNPGNVAVIDIPITVTPTGSYSY